MPTTTRARLGVVGLLAVTTACGGSGVNTPTGSRGRFDPKSCQGGTLRVLNQADLAHLDPARLYTSGGGNIPSLVFRTLTTRRRGPGQEGTRPVPDLATDIGTPSDGARTWTYHLKAGLAFEDGTAITSAEIKYGVERAFAPELPGGAPYLHDWLVGGAGYQGPYQQSGGLAAIETPDRRTLVFRLNKPRGDFPYLATATQFAPVPKAKDTGTGYENHPVSSGPYRVDRYQKDKKLVLVRNPHWSRNVDDQRLACPDRIEVTAGLDPAVINQRLVTSTGPDAKAVTTDAPVGPAQLARLANDPELAGRVARGEFPQTFYLAFNTTVKPFDDLRVRQALAYAVNRAAVVNAAGGTSLAGASTTFLPPQKALGHTPYDYFPAGAEGDPVKARRLLAQAGYPRGLVVSLAHQNDDAESLGPKVATALQDGLARAGITVRLNPIDRTGYRTVSGRPATQPPLSLQSWGADWPSGGPFLIPLFDGRQILRGGGNFNLAQYDDPAVNTAIDQISGITDPGKAARAWGALDARLGRLALVVPLFHSKDVYLFGKDVRNAYVNQWRGQYDLAVLSVR